MNEQEKLDKKFRPGQITCHIEDMLNTCLFLIHNESSSDYRSYSQNMTIVERCETLIEFFK